MNITLLLVLRGSLKENELLSQCTNIIRDQERCKKLVDYAIRSKKYIKKKNDVLILRSNLLTYVNTLYDILYDLNDFIGKVSRREFTVNDIISKSMTPSAMLLVMSSNPRSTGYLDLLLYYFTAMLVAQVFLELSRNYTWFQETITAIENLFLKQ